MLRFISFIKNVQKLTLWAVVFSDTLSFFLESATKHGLLTPTSTDAKK